MLNKLKIKLIFINVSSLVVVLILLVLSVYFIVGYMLKLQERAVLERIAVDEDYFDRRIDLNPPGGITGGNYYESGKSAALNLFYVKKDHHNNIVKISYHIFSNNDIVDDLTKMVDNMGVDYGDISLGEIRLTFFVKYNFYGSVYVFSDRSIREDTMRLFIIIAFIAIAGAVILVFFISLYVANKAIVPIKNSMDMQRNFIADASHELRTPMAVIRANLELVMDNREDTVENQYKWLGYINDQIKRISNMTEKLLYLADMDNTIIKKEEFKEINLSKTIQDTFDAFKPLLDSKNLLANADIQDSVTFVCEEDDIVQLCAIMIDNAVKYTEQGMILLKLSGSDGNAEMIFKDTGIGIEKDECDKIFNRFFRVDKARTRAAGGFGLGLSIADSIIKKYNGTVYVNSVPGTGTEFKIILKR